MRLASAAVAAYGLALWLATTTTLSETRRALGLRVFQRPTARSRPIARAAWKLFTPTAVAPILALAAFLLWAKTPALIEACAAASAAWLACRLLHNPRDDT